MYVQYSTLPTGLGVKFKGIVPRRRKKQKRKNKKKKKGVGK